MSNASIPAPWPRLWQDDPIFRVQVLAFLVGALGLIVLLAAVLRFRGEGAEFALGLAGGVALTAAFALVMATTYR